jgi:hypothetical protein
MGPVAACAWYGDDHLVSAGYSFEHIQDRSIRLWSVPPGAELGVLVHDDPIAAVLGPAMTNSHDHMIALPSPDGMRTAVTTGEVLSTVFCESSELRSRTSLVLRAPGGPLCWPGCPTGATWPLRPTSSP